MKGWFDSGSPSDKAAVANVSTQRTAHSALRLPLRLRLRLRLRLADRYLEDEAKAQTMRKGKGATAAVNDLLQESAWAREASWVHRARGRMLHHKCEYV